MQFLESPGAVFAGLICCSPGKTAPGPGGTQGAGWGCSSGADGLYYWVQGTDPAFVSWPQGRLALCFPLPMGILPWIFGSLIFR